MSVAVAQCAAAPGDVAANVATHLRLAAEAAARGARLVLFPELSLTGYELAAAPRLAFTLDDPRLAPLHGAAERLALTLVVGAPLALPEGRRLGALIIEPGRPARAYTKHRLGAFSLAAACDGVVPPAEATVFGPGTRRPTLTVDGVRCALAICADIGDAAHPARAAAEGARLYLASVFAIRSECAGEHARLAGYARAHRMGVAMANYVGVTGGLVAGGRSGFWGSDGAPLAHLGPHDEGVLLRPRPPASGESA